MKVKAIAPASSANLGPGFDVFGISLDLGYDTVEAQPEKEIIIEAASTGPNAIPLNPESNTAGLVAKKLLGDYGIGGGVRLRIQKGVRPGSGLGSSAASAAATVVALDKLFALELPKNKLVEIASVGEIASAGVAHADNVAPAILGGFTIVRSYDPFDVYRIEPPKDLGLCIALPNIKISTRLGRSVLPKELPMKSVIRNLGNASSMVAGMLLNDFDLIGRSLEDYVAEPFRSRLIPGYDLVKRNAKEAGALGTAISGSGPSMISFINTKANLGEKVAEAMRRGFSEAGLDCSTFVSMPAKGAEVVEVS
jgi:homoserine kinase